ncbi:MAG: hypothetical protein WDZ76_04120 [Pseudohongiellaceae bacterium]
MAEKIALFDKRENVRRLLHVLYFVCATLLLLDLFIHRHVEHSWERLIGFYPMYGFVGCVVLVLVAKWMRTFLMRGEDYYDGRDGTAGGAVGDRVSQEEGNDVGR